MRFFAEAQNDSYIHKEIMYDAVILNKEKDLFLCSVVDKFRNFYTPLWTK
jgi:hypothetical protein